MKRREDLSVRCSSKMKGTAHDEANSQKLPAHMNMNSGSPDRVPQVPRKRATLPTAIGINNMKSREFLMPVPFS